MSDERPERILRIKTVLERTGLSRSTLYRRIESGTFPKQIKIAERCAGWRESAVKEWLKNPMFYSVEDQPPA
jgi:prophage regulatory protein